MKTIYAEHFGLREPPFSLAPDPRYLYASEHHREALAHLLYGVTSEGGFVLLTGDVGTGKTTVLRCLLDRLPDKTKTAFVVHPRLDVVELLATICDEFGIVYPEETASTKKLVDRINAYLLEVTGEGFHAVLIVDEAQNLSTDVLEQLRLLTNLETNRRKLIQILLIGQPELREKVALPEMRQLAQRITARYHLCPLDRAEVGPYIAHRLAVAGGEAALFPESLAGTVFRLTGGVPRLINLLCDRALLGAYTRGEGAVTGAILRQAAGELSGETGAARPSIRTPFALSFAAAVFLALVVFVPGWYGRRLFSAPRGDGSSPGALSAERRTSTGGEGERKTLTFFDEPASEVRSPVLPGPPGKDGKAGAHGAVGTAESGGHRDAAAPGVEETREAAEADDGSDRGAGTADRAVPAEEEAAAKGVDSMEAEAPGPEGSASSQPGAVAAVPVKPAATGSPGREEPDQGGAVPEGEERGGKIPARDLAWLFSGPKGERGEAWTALLDTWGLTLPEGESDFCAFASSRGLRCLTGEGGLSDLTGMNRPAVLRVLGIGGRESYVLLKGLRDGEATLLLNGERGDLRLRWFGSYTLLWKAPDLYQGPVTPGERSPVVAWLRERLDLTAPFGSGAEDYDDRLVEEVRSFQRSKGLPDDGVIDPATIIRLNSGAGEKVPLLDTGPGEG